MSRVYLRDTTVSAARSAGDLDEYLVAGGAENVQNDYADGQISAKAFTLRVEGRLLSFRLPVRVDHVYQHLVRERSRIKDYDALRRKAAAIAWRQALYWVKAQLAMIDTGMVQTVEVFLPYLQSPSGETMFEVIQARGFKALPSPDRKDEQDG